MIRRIIELDTSHNKIIGRYIGIKFKVNLLISIIKICNTKLNYSRILFDFVTFIKVSQILAKKIS